MKGLVLAALGLAAVGAAGAAFKNWREYRKFEKEMENWTSDWMDNHTKFQEAEEAFNKAREDHKKWREELKKKYPGVFGDTIYGVKEDDFYMKDVTSSAKED